MSTASSASSAGGASFLSAATPRSSVSSAGSARAPVAAPTPAPAATSGAAAVKTASTRAYWCTSCGKKLARKFDWKRHEEEFHEQPRKYPCPDCDRVFFGANTFNQHHRVTHRCATCPHADRVVRPNTGRRRRAWGCGFCGAFCGGLERYHEHVALHFEGGKTMAHWDHARVIYGLLHQPAVHPAWRRLQDARAARRPPGAARPKLSWLPDATGRMHGFLDGETPGRLQDLLEFFDPRRHNAEYVVCLADELALHVFEREADGDGGDDGDGLPALPSAPPARASLSPPPPPQWTAPPSLRASVSTVASYAERPLPRVRSQPAYPATTLYQAPAAGAAHDLAFLSADWDHALAAVDADTMMGDWNSLASTIVDDVPFAAPADAHRGWDAPQFLGSAERA